MREKKFGYTS